MRGWKRRQAECRIKKISEYKKDEKIKKEKVKETVDEIK